MEEIVQLNKFSDKLMDLVSVISGLHSTAKSLARQPSQEDLDKLARFMEEFENLSEAMKNILKLFLEEVVSGGKEEITVAANETEFGYKL